MSFERDVAKMEYARLGGYDPGEAEPEVYGECAACGDDIYIGDRYYEYGYKMYCKGCFKEVLFDELADEYREEAGAA